MTTLGLQVLASIRVTTVTDSPAAWAIGSRSAPRGSTVHGFDLEAVIVGVTGKIIEVRQPGLPGRVAGVGRTTAAAKAHPSTVQTWLGHVATWRSTWKGRQWPRPGRTGRFPGGVTWTDSPESAARRTSAGRWSTHVDLDRSGAGAWGDHVAVIGNRSYATAETRVIVARG